MRRQPNKTQAEPSPKDGPTETLANVLLPGPSVLLNLYQFARRRRPELRSLSVRRFRSRSRGRSCRRIVDQVL